MTWVDPKKLFNLRKMPEVIPGPRDMWSVLRESHCKLLGFTQLPVQTSIPRPQPSRIQLPSEIKTVLKYKYNRITGMLDVGPIIELSSRASELDSGVEGLWVINVSEHP